MLVLAAKPDGVPRSMSSFVVMELRQRDCGRSAQMMSAASKLELSGRQGVRQGVRANDVGSRLSSTRNRS